MDPFLPPDVPLALPAKATTVPPAPVSEEPDAKFAPNPAAIASFYDYATQGQGSLRNLVILYLTFPLMRRHMVQWKL